ncbi:hypothetical protein [Actinoplanes utahensis]|uniref:hypothetical protein n=1 Tax=Actinoplanes utahensis TaxID=1869 RepID=UPI001F1C954A|nr:hypothetical protein [Actinoplanes utahensis]
MNWLLATLLTGAAVLAARPGSAARERLLGPRRWPEPSLPRRAVRAVLAGPRWRLLAAATGTAGLAAGLAGGPVGAGIAVTYVGLGLHEGNRAARRKRVGAHHAAALDELSALVADLRAGVPPLSVAANRSRSANGDDRIDRLTDAVWRLAERTGAPAADLLERVERDARAAGRSAKAAAAQAAGAQTTAVLLAALPLAGIALGTVIGGDPAAVLLHTPWGAACAITALALQCAGLKWSQHLTGKAIR